MDKAASHIYALLSRHRASNVSAYIASLHNTDALLKLEHSLGSVTAMSHDLPRAQLFYKMALHHARALRKSHLAVVQGRRDAVLEWDEWLDGLETLLAAHLQNVTDLCG